MVIEFSKPPLSTAALITLLKNKGLAIENEEDAANLLLRLGYYRLKNYVLSFATGCTLSEVNEIIHLDSKLRSLSLEGLEIIELFLRVHINEYFINLSNHPFWYLDETFFDNSAQHQKILNRALLEMHRSREPFIQKYISKYVQPPLPSSYLTTYQTLPPSWMLMQISSLGFLSTLYKNLKTIHRKSLAKKFHLDETIIKSWLHSFTITRNICAHHAVLWNRKLVVSMAYPKKITPHFPRTMDMNQYGAIACGVFYFLKVIDCNSVWGTELSRLLSTLTINQIKSMGINNDHWQNEPFFS